MIDLHTHSTASDGALTPSELARAAAEAGLFAIALTDHDTLDGVEEAIEEGRRAGVRVIPGVEISLAHPTGTCHLIGLFVDPADVPLSRELDRVRAGRRERNLALVRRLGEIGRPIRLEEAAAIAGGDVVARPHFARAMVARGYVRTEKRAFDLWLGKGQVAYVDRYRTPVEDAIALIHGAGGIAVLCHPVTLGLDPADDGPGGLAAFVADLAEKGLDAIETRTGDLAPAAEHEFQRIAKRLGLLASEGSDFHGSATPGKHSGLGRAEGVTAESLDVLEDRARGYR